MKTFRLTKCQKKGDKLSGLLDNLIPRHQRLHYNPSDKVGYRAYAENKEISCGLAYESHKFHLDIIGIYK